MLMKATKFSIRKRHQGIVPGKQKLSVSHRAICRQLKALRIIRLIILTRFLCSEKRNTVFTDPNIVKLNITTQRK